MEIEEKHVGVKRFLKIVCLLLVAYLVLVSLDVILNDTKPLYIYNENIILGKTRDEVAQIYGEPDFTFCGDYCYKVTCFFSTQHYCYVEFDDKVAVNVDDACGYP